MERWPVRYRLAAALVVPLLTVVALSAFLIAAQVRTAHAASRTRSAAELTIQVNRLIRALGQERYTASTWVASAYRVGSADNSAARPPVDKAFAQVQAASFPDDPRLRLALATAEKQMGQLSVVRKSIDAKTAGISGVGDTYNGIVAAWLGVTAAQVGVGTSDQEVARTVTALTAISNLTEQVAQQRGYVALTVFLHDQVADNVARIRAAVGGEAAWLSQFNAAADSGQRQFYDQQVAPARTPAVAIRDKVLTEAQSGQAIDIDPEVWKATVTTEIDRLRTVEAQITTDLTNRSSSLASAATARAWLVALAAAAIMAVAIGVSVVIAQRLVRQLRALREGAVAVAEERLPAVTAAIRARRPLAEDFDDNSDLESDDEIGDVARALHDVYTAAVNSATEVAAQHSLSSSMRNLARRSQALIHRQLKLITDLERDQQDPDMLERLFRLDHLATRMRREVEGQIALSGGRPSRVFRSPVKVIDSMRAAVAEVESYTRVEASTTVDDRLVGPVVGDLIHLLAELIENACQMSPERTPVLVTSSRVGTGVAVEVEDRGVGIAPATMAELNRRLADPPPFNSESEGDKLGLWVVANLAARHQITVQLARNPYGGVTAIALLPSNVLAEADLVDTPDVPDDEPLKAALARMNAFDRLDMVGAGYEEPPLPPMPIRGRPGEEVWPSGVYEEPRPADRLDDRPVDRRPRPLADADDVPEAAVVRAAFFAPPPARNGAPNGAANGAPNGGPHGPGNGAPAGAPGGRTDGLPVFDMVAADWTRGPVPVAPQSPPTAPLPAPPPAAPRAVPRPVAVPPPPPPPPTRSVPPRPVPAAHLPVPVPDLPAPRAVRPVPGDPPLGHLPHRRRGANLSEALRGGRPVPAPGGPARNEPDPDKARRLVTSFRAGFQQGQGLPAARDDERTGDATHR
ncbi:sensor histidine kinase [Pseudofrankia inefficax]|uniref:histidine kinase n=1 Tax=Pseudofrankia inefficax (strain DSM 45817 / CECT 9037 / DDB 130130 / EuI1c) TaxID=298654 RepID=E3IWU1_PSEI1|nr:nitrate- and nitrite sensing domain-containing protein [Pseudofrankia inefficax]ADP82565.1 integral membrane sensor signal transduction histidine kinase [Pseudofrankia inefficax]